MTHVSTKKHIKTFINWDTCHLSTFFIALTRHCRPLFVAWQSIMRLKLNLDKWKYCGSRKGLFLSIQFCGERVNKKPIFLGYVQNKQMTPYLHLFSPNTKSLMWYSGIFICIKAKRFWIWKIFLYLSWLTIVFNI